LHVGPAMKTYEIDGARFSDVAGFYEEVSRVLLSGAKWGRNLDAFSDILSGGFGTPEEGFVLRWRNSERSKQQLGPVFGTLVRIIKDHGAGGEWPEDNVSLELA
jgi:RNAse (barnase) inhibitor barstar